MATGITQHMTNKQLFVSLQYAASLCSQILHTGPLIRGFFSVKLNKGRQTIYTRQKRIKEVYLLNQDSSYCRSVMNGKPQGLNNKLHLLVGAVRRVIKQPGRTTA